MTDLTAVPWRAFAGATIYAGDELIGTMRTQDLAEAACTAHNAELSRRKASERGVRGGSGIQIGDGGIQYNNF